MTNKIGVKYYFLYGIVLGVTLLFFRFPTIEFKNYITNQVEQILPLYSCQIETLSYKFPFSLTAQKINLFPRNNRSNHIQIDELTLKPSLMNFTQRFNLTGKLYDGELAVTLRRLANKNGFSLENLIISNLNINDVTGFKIKGRIDIDATYQVNYIPEPNTTIFKGEITLKNGMLTPPTPLLTLDEIDLNYMKLFFSQNNNRIEIRSGQLKGSELHGKFAGILNFDKPTTVINLVGELTPLQSFLTENEKAQQQVKTLQKRFRTKSLPLKVEGTSQSPVIAIKK